MDLSEICHPIDEKMDKKNRRLLALDVISTMSDYLSSRKLELAYAYLKHGSIGSLDDIWPNDDVEGFVRSLKGFLEGGHEDYDDRYDSTECCAAFIASVLSEYLVEIQPNRSERIYEVDYAREMMAKHLASRIISKGDKLYYEPPT